MMKLNRELIGCLLLGVVLLAGCEKKDIYKDKKNLTKDDFFDFSTTRAVSMELKYEVPEGCQVYFEIYRENPLVLSADGKYDYKREDVECIANGMTDIHGIYRHQNTLPAWVKGDVYIYTSYPGVPRLFKAVVAGDALRADINYETLALQEDAGLKSKAGNNKIYHNVLTGYHTFGSWDDWGYPDYLEKVKMNIPGDLLNNISKLLPEAGGTLNNQKYRQAIDFLITDSAEIQISLISSSTSAKSTFGYYCYPQGANTEQILAAKKCIIFPKAVIDKHVAQGACFKLRYVTADGVDHGTKFPPSVKIGWVICNDAWGLAGKNGGLGTGYGERYSTPGCNSFTEPSTVAFKKDDYIVLGFEDWYQKGGNEDYKDLLFCLKATPIDVITNVPDVEVPPEEEVAYTKTYKGILAFEDNWPEKGDYDLNDVVMRYHSVVSYDKNNNVLKTNDDYTLLGSGARYHNAFGYQLSVARSEVKELKINGGQSVWSGRGMDAVLDRATVMLFSDAKNESKNNTVTSSFNIQTTFVSPVAHDDFVVVPYNPFIAINGSMDMGRIEVHPVNYAPTTKVGVQYFRQHDDLSIPEEGVYYVSEEAYPFAINLSEAEDYDISIEAVKINITYPDFDRWVKSSGKEYTDWYLKK